MARLSKSDAPVLNNARLLAEEWIIPDAQSEHNTLARLLGDLRESTPSVQGTDRLEVNPELLEPRIKVAYDLLRKYGVLVDPYSLSDMTVARLRARKNYPKVTSGYTLREWSDMVLGEGEQVDFYLPHSPRRNTHLGTVRYLCTGAETAITELLKSVQPGPVKELGTVLAVDEQQNGEIPIKVESDSVLREEVNAFRNVDQADQGLLSLLNDKAKDRWSPLIQTCINDLAQAGSACSDAEMMVRLLDRINHPKKFGL
ncbi:TPA: hypothetical protein U8251_000022 [Pseudomonas putida]|nr:hypothetical protein [Pseudomonas putida]